MNIQRCFGCKLLVTVRAFLHQRGNTEDWLLPRLAAHFGLVRQLDLQSGQISAGKVREGLSHLVDRIKVVSVVV